VDSMFLRNVGIYLRVYTASDRGGTIANCHGVQNKDVVVDGLGVSHVGEGFTDTDSFHANLFWGTVFWMQLFFWVVTPRELTGQCRRLEGTHCFLNEHIFQFISPNKVHCTLSLCCSRRLRNLRCATAIGLQPRRGSVRE
jgi:hypothetical protein